MVDFIFFTVFISIGQEDGIIVFIPSLAKIKQMQNSFRLYHPKIFFSVYIYSCDIKPRPATPIPPRNSILKALLTFTVTLAFSVIPLVLKM